MEDTQNITELTNIFLYLKPTTTSYKIYDHAMYIRLEFRTSIAHSKKLAHLQLLAVLTCFEDRNFLALKGSNRWHLLDGEKAGAIKGWAQNSVGNCTGRLCDSMNFESWTQGEAVLFH